MQRNYDFDLTHERKNKNIFIILIPLLILVIALAWLGNNIFKISNQLMTREGEAFNPIASHLMPSFEEYQFNSFGSDLKLKGWFFKAKSAARGNVILVHSNGYHRLQYGLDSAELIQFLMDESFNVLAFDLRHSGLSEGSHSTYGYSEYKDVQGALQFVAKLSGQTNFILYGFGSGVSANLLAWDELKDRPIDENDIQKDRDEGITVYKDDIEAILCDSPPASVDEYIRADLNPKSRMSQLVYLDFVPRALRLSSGSSAANNLIPLASQYPGPMMITRNLPDLLVSDASINAFIDERLRLNPATTMVFEIREAGHMNGYLLSKEDYLNNLKLFFDQWFD